MTTLWAPSWQHEAVEIKENNFMHRGFFQVQELTLRHKCFSGEWSPWLKREQVRSNDAAAVLLVDTLKKQLIMVEQFRIGLVNRKENPWLLEVVAGLQERGETPVQTMQREAKEEANCHINDWIQIGEFYNSPGGFAEKTTLFCGLVNADGASGIYGQGEEHEDIRVHVLDLHDTLSSFNSGALVSSSATLIALQWLAMNWQKHPFLIEKIT